MHLIRELFLRKFCGKNLAKFLGTYGTKVGTFDTQSGQVDEDQFVSQFGV